MTLLYLYNLINSGITLPLNVIIQFNLYIKYNFNMYIGCTEILKSMVKYEIIAQKKNQIVFI